MQKVTSRDAARVGCQELPAMPTTPAGGWPGTCGGQDIGQLTALVRTRLRQTQHRSGLVDGFLAKTGLDLSNTQN